MDYRGFVMAVIFMIVCLQKVHIHFQSYFYDGFRRETVFLTDTLDQQRDHYQLMVNRFAHFKRYIHQLVPVMTRCMECVEEKEKKERGLARVRPDVQTRGPSGGYLFLFNVGKTLFHMKDYEGAIQAFERFVEAQDEKYLVVEALYFLMECHFLMDHRRESLEVVEKLVRLYPHSQWTGYGLLRRAQIYRRQGREPEALEAYERVLREFPHGDLGRQVRENLEESF